MDKKGEVNSHIIIYALVVIIAVVILAFGVKMIGNFLDSSCQAELKAASLDLTESIEALANRVGNTEEKTFASACGIDRAYFVDLPQVLPEMFSSYPEIQSSIREGQGNNMFFYKQNELVYAIKTKLDMSFPHFTCAKSIGGGIRILLTVSKGGTDIKDATAGKSPCNGIESAFGQESTLPANIQQAVSASTGLKDTVVQDNYKAALPGLLPARCVVSDDRKKMQVLIGYNHELENLSVYHILPYYIDDAYQTFITGIYPIEIDDESETSDIETFVSDRYIFYRLGKTFADQGVILIEYDFDGDGVPAEANDYCNIVQIEKNYCTQDIQCTYGVCRTDNHCAVP